MTIHDITSGAIRSGATRDPRSSAGATEGDEVRGVSQVERVDRVEISEKGRALAEASAASATRGTLSPERLAQINQRVEDRAYDSAEVAEEVARRLLDAGDL